MLIVDGGGSDLKRNGDNRGQFFSFGETKFGQQLLLSRGRPKKNGKKEVSFFARSCLVSISGRFQHLVNLG